MDTRRLILALGILSVTCVGAAAADLPMKAPSMMMPPPVVYNWTGFYIGGNVGWKHMETDMSSAPNDAATTVFNTACINANACPQNYGSSSGDGVIGGIQAGYNWQVQTWVLGIEADFQGTSATASTTINVQAPGFLPYTGTNETKQRWLGTVRGRAGYLFTPMLLGYVTGGWAYGNVERSWTGAFPTFTSSWSGSGTDTLSGWTVGGGFEWALGNGFTIGAEYLYVRLDGGDSFLTTTQGGACATGAPRCTFNITGADVTDNIVRVKVNYKF
jgi:outer membrane immunogenic protein